MFKKIVDLDLEDLRHNSLDAYIIEGYGGRPIEEWPFYIYINEYVNGNKENAINNWIDWLYNQFSKYKYWDKSKGGMYGGSVHRGASEFNNNLQFSGLVNPSILSKEEIVHGAKKLVNKRLLMIESVINNGYISSMGDPIYAVKGSGYQFILKGGHHRSALLKVLGYDKLSNVILVSSVYYQLRTKTATIKRKIFNQ